MSVVQNIMNGSGLGGATATLHAGKIPETLRALTVPIDSLKPYGRNPRMSDLGPIKDSLERHGQYRPIVVRQTTKEILAGNHTWRAAKALGWREIAVTFIECGDSEAAQIVLIDNRLGDIGKYDEDILAGLLQDLAHGEAGLKGTGYDEAALAELLTAFQPDPEAPQGKLDHRPTVTCPNCGEAFELGE